jgi:hypothetical protein
MAVVITILRLVLTAGVVFVVPAIAVRALRTGDRTRLRSTVVAVAGLVLLFVLMASSARFGNALAETDGYWLVAIRVLAVAAVQFGTPVLAALAAVRMFERDKLPFWVLYACTTGAAAVGWIVGQIGSFFFAGAVF